jgi:hypothetical protein
MRRGPPGIVERYKPKASRNRYVITDQLVDQVWHKMQSGPVLGGEIAKLIWGVSGPPSQAAWYEGVSQLSQRYEERYGVALMSTTAYRPEQYSGERLNGVSASHAFTSQVTGLPGSPPCNTWLRIAT